MTTAKPYINLHGHTNFSVQDGHALVNDYVQRAAALDHPAVAMTDHGNMAAAPSFLRAAKSAGIKPIVGLEAYTTAGYSHQIKDGDHRKAHHLTLLAMNQVGYKNLAQMSTLGFTDGFYYHPRIDRDILHSHREGVICLSGCIACELALYVLNGEDQRATDLLTFYHETFGENFYLELQNHGPLIPDQIVLNKELVQMARKYGIPVVGTNDSHFCQFQDAPAHKVLMEIKGKGGLKSSPYTYVRSNEEMAMAFPDRALWHTLEIGEKIETYDLGDPVPKLPISPLEGHNNTDPGIVLATLVRDGLQRRLDCSWADVPWDYEARMDEELSVIAEMGRKLGVPFERYLLIIADIARFCKEERIRFGPRGSAAGALVCWALGISEPDPLKEDLIFERFLNKDRIELPDVDLDFQDSKRHLVLQYMIDTYGDANVARIGTYSAIGARGAIRDAARIRQYDISKNYVVFANEMTSHIPHDTRPGGMPLDEVLAIEDGKLAEMVVNDPDAKTVIDTAMQLNGRMRGTSTHAAGVVIGDQPLIDILPLMRVSNPEKETIKQQTQYEMGELESLGLLKFDILGLQTLTMMEDAVTMAEASSGQRIDLWNLPTDDGPTWDIIEHGDTLGLFQLGGRGMTRALMQVKPRTIQELAMVIAIFRPGPVKNLPTIAQRKNLGEAYDPIHPSLDNILSKTFGFPVYQEQIMEIMVVVAGFSRSKADIVRKAMGKKKRDLMASFKTEFDAGGLSRGYTQEELDKIWDEVVPFADYGFNRAHAVCYAYLAYQSAWLKAHFPVPFYAAALTVESRAGSKAGETSQGRIGNLSLEARQRGLTILSPDINVPVADFTPEGTNAIRYGLSCIKGVGLKDVIVLQEAIEAEGQFTSLADLVLRTSKINRKVYDVLIQVGAVDFGNRNTLLTAMEDLIKIRRKRSGRPRKGETLEEQSIRTGQRQVELFEQAKQDGYVVLQETDLVQRLQWELENLGIVTTDLPRIPGVPTTCSITHLNEHINERVTVVGVLANIDVFTTKKRQVQMAYATLLDAEGSVSLLIWPKTYEKSKEYLRSGQIVMIMADVDVEKDAPTPDWGEVRGGFEELEPKEVPASLVRLRCEEVKALDIVEPVNVIPERLSALDEPMTFQLPDGYEYEEAIEITSNLYHTAADYPGDHELTVVYKDATDILHVNRSGLATLASRYPEFMS